ncbi:MAG TPA: hypothetical protein PLV68_12245, partial [Ilumatobacteraceae bacterium]|nr:hypothetical protein [Ilumatobacteraceae bacterium]
DRSQEVLTARHLASGDAPSTSLSSEQPPVYAQTEPCWNHEQHLGDIRGHPRCQSAADST